MTEDAELLAEQVRYYRERAAEYDDWWYRRGRYDHGPAETPPGRPRSRSSRPASARSS